MEAAGLGEEVNVRVDVTPDAEGALVPGLLLLPLAQNAIKHGTARPASGRRIEVQARREGDRLRVQMSNDCEGDTAASETSPRPGSGLAKTSSRLSHFYGTSHRFEARYSPGVGFLADVEVPYRLHRLAARGAAKADETRRENSFS